MTYQGERARPLASESGRVFEVSKVRFDAGGNVTAVLWGEVDSRTDLDVDQRVQATVEEVIEALHDGAAVVAVFSGWVDGHHELLPERAFEVVEHQDGRERIALAGAPSPKRNLADIARLDD